jgi:crooked neck
MKWEPDDNAWFAYVKFEMRQVTQTVNYTRHTNPRTLLQGEIGRARGVYERYIELHVTCRAYLKYARFEEKQHQKAFARQVQ